MFLFVVRFLNISTYFRILVQPPPLSTFFSLEVLMQENKEGKFEAIREWP